MEALTSSVAVDRTNIVEPMYVYVYIYIYTYVFIIYYLLFNMFVVDVLVDLMCC